MSKSKAKSPPSSRARVKQRDAVSAPAKPRGTQNEANLKAIIENRTRKPKLADLRANKDAALQLPAKWKRSNLNAVAQMTTNHTYLCRLVGAEPAAGEERRAN